MVTIGRPDSYNNNKITATVPNTTVVPTVRYSTVVVCASLLNTDLTVSAAQLRLRIIIKWYQWVPKSNCQYIQARPGAVKYNKKTLDRSLLPNKNLLASVIFQEWKIFAWPRLWTNFSNIAIENRKLLVLFFLVLEISFYPYLDKSELPVNSTYLHYKCYRSGPIYLQVRLIVELGTKVLKV